MTLYDYAVSGYRSKKYLKENIWYYIYYGMTNNDLFDPADFENKLIEHFEGSRLDHYRVFGFLDSQDSIIFDIDYCLLYLFKLKQDHRI